MIQKRRLAVDSMVPSREGEEGFSLVEVSMVLSVLAVLGVVVVAPGISKLIRHSE